MHMLRQVLQTNQQRGVTKALIFGGTKRTCDELVMMLRQSGYQAAAIHKDKQQYEREQALQALKQQDRFLLVGIPPTPPLWWCVLSALTDLPLVINFDFPQELDDYVHRIGRTGRAGRTGEAVTFFTEKDCGFARGLIG
eukprot:gene5718-35346_t